MKNTLHTPLAEFSDNLTKNTLRLLARLSIHTLQDVLFHFPLRYQNRTTLQKIADLRLQTEAVVQGVIETLDYFGGNKKLACTLKDETGVLTLRFFHLLPYQKTLLKKGVRVRCYGEIVQGHHGYEIVHPEFQLISSIKPLSLEKTLTAIYPSTEGLTQYRLRQAAVFALKMLAQTDTEILPENFLTHLNFPSHQHALQFIHAPFHDVNILDLAQHKTHAHRRLIFEELLAERLSLLNFKKNYQAHISPTLMRNGKLIDKFKLALPFQLTNAQIRVATEISDDLVRDIPMLRLVQGDVGSGKTVIAALAILQATENGYQTALMAPTELLAEQHARVFTKWFAALNLSVAFLTGQIKGKKREALLDDIASGAAQVVIGTHALFQEAVIFSKLGLVVIDEQHRFGVAQRAALREKGMHGNIAPHQLVMTATPIPRTLAMSAYADLDCSIIDELPKGRTPIVTSVIYQAKRDEVIKRVQAACEEGRQIYWVCPLIEESETLACQAAINACEELQQKLPGIKVGLIHGRMKADEKNLVMNTFAANEMQILVATTVIEVGVDVPNASVMIIENAERLGLSQLHQLRGRVGRGQVASFCVLLYQYPISAIGRERLAVMRETNDGFKIAEKDLELRGAGEILGTKQTGEKEFYIADLVRDNYMMNEVSAAAEKLFTAYPEKIAPFLEYWKGRDYEYGKV